MRKKLNFQNETFRKVVCNLSIISILLIVCIAFNYPYSFSLEDRTLARTTNKDYIFLSDLDYITENNWSYNGWGGHELQKDKNQDGGTLSLLVDGEKRLFTKGLGVHAKGQVTFDVSRYATNYPRFIAYIGVDATRGQNGSIWFKITASRDGSSWDTLLDKTNIMTGLSNAISVDLNIKDYRYLRIYVDPNGANAADHGTIAGARLVKKDYDINSVYYDKIHKVEYYDSILSTHDTEYNYQHNYRLILEREIVNKFGFFNIQDLVEFNPSIEETFNWILSSNQVMEQVIEVGKLADGSKFLKILADLYSTYKNELKKTDGYVYQKMMIALSATYTSDGVLTPLKFGGSAPSYDYKERFSIVKQLYDNGQLMVVENNQKAGNFIPNEWFKDYHIELMRLTLQNGILNGDYVWLNGYTHYRKSLSEGMAPYLSPNYNQAKLYDEANRKLYTDTYLLDQYNIPYGERVQRYWMVFAAGGICWNQSRLAQAMYRVNGIPAVGAYQPGHELYIHYYQNANGDGFWTPRYGNWGSAGSTWGGGQRYRYIFDWGNKYFADQNISGSKGGTSTGYIYLGQENLNHLKEYQKSLYYNLIANSYSDNNKKIETYFKALEVNDKNLDSYDYIISLYKTMSIRNEGGTITPHDWYNLAKKVIDSYTYYPVAMFDLLKVIRPYLEGAERLDIDRLEKESLTLATTAPSDKTNSVDGTRTHARQLLGKAQPDPMTFSFDGENAGRIVKNAMYSLTWSYSLDGGETFSNQTEGDSVALSQREIESITAENDIIIRFMGLTYTFRIDITKGVIGNNLFANDLENRVVGVSLVHEWRNSEKSAWTSYQKASPDNTGDKTLYVRKGATGTSLPSDSVRYTFTEDNQPNTRKYVSVSHLSIEAVSTEAVSNAGAAVNAIDGNYNTRWHSAWNGTDTERFITIKLDKPRYVSAVEFVPAGGGNGRINDGTIWGSTDGISWEKLSEKRNITYPTQANTNEQAIQYTQSFEIAEPKEVQYIKIVADRTNGNWFTARAFNIFQDLTKDPRPTAGIGYSTKDPTRENVVARLVNVSTDKFEILSPGGDTHTFTENGEFTFRFRNTESGMEGSAKAVVYWIDRESPTASIEYSTQSPTTGSVFATLKPNEDVIVTNNGEYRLDEEGLVTDSTGNVLEGYTVDEEGNIQDVDGSVIGNLNTFTYEFISNGEFTFEFIDRAGNSGSQTASVSWIDAEPPVASLHYDITNLTNQNVTVTIDFNENAMVTNNAGSRMYTFVENGEFTFEFRDDAGNASSITARVNWIDKIPPTAELKYEKQSNKVIVKVVNFSENITFQEGIGIYEFTQNGNYDIVFYDQAGNIGKLTAIINHFKSPTNNSNNNNSGNSQNNSGNSNKPPTNSTNHPSPSKKPDSSSSTSNSGPSPTVGNNGNSSNGSGNGGSINTIRPTNKEYQKFKNQDITVEIPKSAVSTGTSLKADIFELDDSLKNKVGGSSEFYDIYLLNLNSKRLEVNTSAPMKISINLKKEKKFLGVYELTKQNELKEVEYERNGDSIEILAKRLGKYIVSYDEFDETEVEIPKKTGFENIILIVLIMGIIITILDLIFYFIKKRRKHREDTI